MSDVFAINELVAANRRATLEIFESDRTTPAPCDTDFTGCVTIDQSTGNFIAASGSLVNSTAALTFTDQTFTYSSGNNVTATAHPFVTGDGPERLITTGALPTGLAVATDYWINVVDANTVAYATSRANAFAATKITLSGTASGTNKITATGTTPLRPLPGLFDYVATQAETNFVGNHLIVRVEKASFARALARVAMSGLSDVWDAICEGSYTYGDVHRVNFATLNGKSGDYTTGTYTFKDPSTGTKTRVTFTADATGRLAATIGDPTP